VQGSRSWTPPTGTLGQIVAETRPRIEALAARTPELARMVGARSPGPLLVTALSGSTVGVIAEIKRKSPSKGWIRPGLGAGAQATAYHGGGAAAISVLTEPKHFDGTPEDLIAVRRAVGLPILKKDFHVDPVQLLEAKAIGADAALLIARALSPAELVRMMRDADRLDLETVVEVRDEDELARALDAGASIIGVNNRNLETLEIDPRTSERLLAKIPAGVIAIAESGVKDRADVERAAAWGADAVLVGSAISAADDPQAAVRALAGIARSRGGRGPSQPMGGHPVGSSNGR
jgi:indole-3-glycerol phosphate synthase